MLGPLLFNIDFNYLFSFLEEMVASNFADDTNIYACDIDFSNLLRWLEHDSLITINWFENNYMKLNRDKCISFLGINMDIYLLGLENIRFGKVNQKKS